MDTFYRLLICLCISLSAHSLPTNPKDSSLASGYASDASQLVAINLLKSNIDIDGNQVYSPLGVTTLLAILSEGSAGETYDEFQKVFGPSKERNALRENFKRILTKYQNRDYSAASPSFQTWFYTYRNYSAENQFKQLMRDFYFVEVKDINRNEYDWSEPSTSVVLKDETPAVESNSKDVIGFDTLKRINVDDIVDELTTAADAFGEESPQKEASKFDRFVEEKQYVEKPVLLEEIQKEKEAQLDKETELKKQSGDKPAEPATPETKKESMVPSELEKLEKPLSIEPTTAEEKKLETELESKFSENSKIKREDEPNVEENETVQAEEKLQSKTEERIASVGAATDEGLQSNQPEKVSIPLQKLENAIDSVSKDAGEIMVALESHLSSVRRAFGGRSLFNKDDISSALSANSITGRELGSKTKMLLFNGLYYRGNWAYPFFSSRAAQDAFFYMTSEDVIKVPTMTARGKFYTSDLAQLNAKALCIPYENKKYALLVIVPNDFEGLRSVIEKLQPSDLKMARANAIEQEMKVALPKFQVEETSRSESMLKGLGLKKLFTRGEADLSLLSKDRDLHVDELVQYVTVRVDEGGSATNAISASNIQERNSAKDSLQENDSQLDTFEVNRPFLYFVMDCEEDFVIASGKIYAPEMKEDPEPSVIVEVELDRVQ